MKIEQEDKWFFKPITITLETKEEARLFQELGITSSLIAREIHHSDNDVPYDKMHRFLDQIEDLMGGFNIPTY